MMADVTVTGADGVPIQRELLQVYDMKQSDERRNKL
jgi:hypothetical protein